MGKYIFCFPSVLSEAPFFIPLASDRDVMMHVIKYFHNLESCVTASVERLGRDIGVEEQVPWSGTDYHDTSSLCSPKDSRSRGGGTVSRDTF